ncbi:MAG TPA: hypothetical protein VKZ53_13035 [Candidatus Angelobacter sp.]|nr:hypothetical protein [Candidatus Angelobacter sp.]
MKTALIVAVTVLCAVLMGCAGHSSTQTQVPVTPSQQTPLRQIDSAAFKMAAILDTGEKEIESVYAANLISTDEAIAAGIAANNAISLNQTFIGRIKTLNSIDVSNRQQVVQWVSELSAGLAKLNSQGVLGVKNTQAQKRLGDVFATLPLLLQTINAAVDAVKTSEVIFEPKHYRAIAQSGVANVDQRDRTRAYASDGIRSVGCRADCESRRDQLGGASQSAGVFAEAAGVRTRAYSRLISQSGRHIENSEVNSNLGTPRISRLNALGAFGGCLHTFHEFVPWHTAFVPWHESTLRDGSTPKNHILGVA